MTIEVADLPTGRLIRLQRHHRVGAGRHRGRGGRLAAPRAPAPPCLGDRFASLEALPGPAAGYAVSLADGSRHLDAEVDLAYLQALLAVL